ncbi:MAG TPA: DUF1254 domain-containing protein [Chitinophagales bacterium]|nr:DUF1254 domain-containing protein [Chitinophagales bacterium]
MKKTIWLFIIGIALAAVTQWAVVKYIPNAIYRIAVHRSGKEANRWINAPKTSASLRRVVLPNPDFVYSALFYDVSEHDIIITGFLPDSNYASVSFYDNRCQPWYVYNNLSHHRAGPFWFRLSRHGLKGVNELQAKTNRGVILCRYLSKTDSTYAQMQAYQKLLTVEVK